MAVISGGHGKPLLVVCTNGFLLLAIERAIGFIDGNNR
jgi:hypothetical protein